MKKAGLLKKITILVLVLMVPGFLYYLLTVEGKNHYVALSVFGPKRLAGTTHRVKGKDIPDTIFHTLPDFKLTDQDGNAVTLASFNQKIFVINFFYAGCPNICNVMNSNMAQLVDAYKNNKMVCFVSVTVNPKDSVAVLKKYAETFKAIPSKWMFLTGDTSITYNLARNGLLVNALQTGKDDFIYSDKLMLIDESRRIRGYYNGVSTTDVSKLNDEIKVLVSEEILKNDKPLY